MIKVQFKSFSKDIISKEDEAAKILCENLEKEFALYPNAKGTIYILTSIRIFGQKRNDIDMLIMGFLEKFSFKNIKTKNFGVVDELEIKSFICNIELKGHTSSGIIKEGTDYIVHYNKVPSNASQQCQEAKFSLRNHLFDQLSINPFFSDILWFNGLSNSDLISLRGNSYDNALPCLFSFKDLINVILLQSEVRVNCRNYVLDCFKDGEKDYKSIVDLFTMVRTPKGLTKDKFELLSQQSTEVEKLLEDVGNKLTIVTGRAGTGKTVQLLQLAFQLASSQNNKRCIILTYNQALVSDINRLIDYTPMPSHVDGRTVAIKTIHSFFQTLMKDMGLSVKHLIPTNNTYEKDYNAALQELYNFVVKECKKEDIEALKDMIDSYIDWDYILIDEAQDFSEIEKKILFKVYGSNRLVVADGVDQFMRNNERQIWDRGMKDAMVRKPKTMVLERRQKSNLVSFVNAYAKLVGLDWEVRPNQNLPGGNIIILPDFRKHNYDDLKDNCERNNCENYDILILQPPTQVTIDKNGNRYFTKAEAYNRLEIPIYDGINNRNRTMYPTKDQCRVYQYDSCRGLEGWCVVCADFDELIDYKLNTINLNGDELGFDQDKIKLKKTFLWSLMPLTRPIDTLVITLKNPNSEVGKILKQLADVYSDFITWKF